ncbi:MAG: hypothetical protein COT31_03610 [Candidatus Moranbacteria bacterium CG08_land_8_20_14_0_20_34_16]|nr:MAG: hypothetical protein COT31_03610 [Candidatus Moranbacteria bacterium CG08_land_8_20_14_0_20_34_16]
MEEQQKSPVKMLWFSFVGVIAIYVFVAYQQITQKNQPISFKTDDLSAPMFIGATILSLILIMAAHYFIPKLLNPTDSKDPKQTLVLQLLQFALSEVAGILGLVLFFSNGSFAQLTVLCAIAFISLISFFPRESTI